MKTMEIKLTELPKYRYDIIINNIKSEFGVDIDKNNDIRITLYIDREKGIYADVTNKLNISKKNPTYHQHYPSTKAHFYNMYDQYHSNLLFLI